MRSTTELRAAVILSPHNTGAPMSFKEWRAYRERVKLDVRFDGEQLAPGCVVAYHSSKHAELWLRNDVKNKNAALAFVEDREGIAIDCGWYTRIHIPRCRGKDSVRAIYERRKARDERNESV